MSSQTGHVKIRRMLLATHARTHTICITILRQQLLQERATVTLYVLCVVLLIRFVRYNYRVLLVLLGLIVSHKLLFVYVDTVTFIRHA